jgi:hypothetical protein
VSYEVTLGGEPAGATVVITPVRIAEPMYGVIVSENGRAKRHGCRLS